MRRYYIDNLRWLAVLLLIPYHTAMIYNNWGELFYVKGENNAFLSGFISITWPWYMPLLFVLAGVSARYALEKRSGQEFLKERGTKLLIPLLSVILLVIPVQTYYAEKFHNQFTGSYWEQYRLFFTKPTDLTGYQGGFTPGQMWFVLYLLVITVLALPLMLWLKKKDYLLNRTYSFITLLLLFLVPCVMQTILDIQGKSLGEYFAFFMLGYIIIGNEAHQKLLERYRFGLLGSAIVLMIANYLVWNQFDAVNEVFAELLYSCYALTMIYALLGLGKRYMNGQNAVTAYLSRSSFAVYMFHQSWLVMAGYYCLQMTDSIVWQCSLIMLWTVVGTFLSYELLRRFKVSRFLFALK